MTTVFAIPYRLTSNAVCRQCRRSTTRSPVERISRLAFARLQSTTAGTARGDFSAEFFRWNGRLRDLTGNRGFVDSNRGPDAVTHGFTSSSSLAQATHDGGSRRIARARRQPNASDPQEYSIASAGTAAEAIIPPDASSQLSTISATLPKKSFRRTYNTYLALSKPRLTFLIVLTTTAAYTMYPVPAMLDPTAMEVPSLSPITLLFLTTGTFLSSASANAFNMLMEPKHDAKMSRTRNRPLVRNLLSKRAALAFAIVSGMTGTTALYFGVNPTTAFLGLSNILLYAAVYTPLKRIHPINTWVGALVGAIPPLMGWTAAAGQCASDTGDWHELLTGTDSRGGWALAGLLFLWQLPHFAALSWTIRHEYAAAGYKMLCSSNPRLDAVFSLVCAAGLQACTTQLLVAEVIDSWAFVAMTPANAWITLKAWQFLRLGGAKSSARNLFWASVWYLPIVLVLGMVGKKGLSERVSAWFAGEVDEADDVFYDEDEEQLESQGQQQIVSELAGVKQTA